MAHSPTRLADVLALAKTLTPLDRVRLVEQVMVSLEQDMEPTPPPTQRRSLYGVLAHLGPAPSADEIDAARREMWGDFPREDI